MEVPRLGVELELQLQACTTATARPDLSRIFDLHHSSCNTEFFDPPSKARDGTPILMVTSWVCFHYTTTGTPFDSSAGRSEDSRGDTFYFGNTFSLDMSFKRGFRSSIIITILLLVFLCLGSLPPPSTSSCQSDLSRYRCDHDTPLSKPIQQFPIALSLVSKIFCILSFST